MRTDPVLTQTIYKLQGDGWTLGFVKKAEFSTTTSVSFDVDETILRIFADSFSLRKGLLPFHNVSLIVLSTSFEELVRYTWRYAVVTNIGVPALISNSGKLPVFCVKLSVVDAPPDSQNKSIASVAYGSRRDPVGIYIIRLTIDGTKGQTSFLSEVEGFTLGGNGNLNVSVEREQMADPFRSWLQSGNALKTGSLALLGSDLNIWLKFNFTGLRVRSVVPPLTTYAAVPGRISLSYSGVALAPQ